MLISIDARGATWYAGTGIGTYTRQVLMGKVEGKVSKEDWRDEDVQGYDTGERCVFIF